MTDPSTKATKQLGDNWDRTLLEHSDLENSLFLGGSEFSGSMGQFVYLGLFENQHLFATAKHVVDQKEDLCDRLVNIKSSAGKTIFDCDLFILSLEESDISLISMKPRAHFDSTSLNALRLQKNLKAGDRLQLVTRSAETSQLFVDASPDCVAVTDAPKKIADPDSSDESGLYSWSIPVGCDAEHGDSGAPALNQQNEVIGFLWTGKYPKEPLSSLALQALLQSQSPRIWSDLNYIVPVAKIIEEIEKKLASGELSQDIQRPLEGWLKSLVIH